MGDTVHGKLTATDNHIWAYRLIVTPSVANPPAISPTGQTYPLLAAPGLIDEPFDVTTTALTTPCGYVIRLEVWDRTIRNNYMPGNWNYADVGLCLLEAE